MGKEQKFHGKRKKPSNIFFYQVLIILFFLQKTWNLFWKQPLEFGYRSLISESFV